MNTRDSKKAFLGTLRERIEDLEAAADLCSPEQLLSLAEAGIRIYDELGYIEELEREEQGDEPEKEAGENGLLNVLEITYRDGIEDEPGLVIKTDIGTAVLSGRFLAAVRVLLK